MVKLTNAQTGELIGTISDEDLRFLQADLEEEGLGDTDYYINQVTVDWLESEGASPAMVSMLRKALGGQEDMDIHWEPL